MTIVLLVISCLIFLPNLITSVFADNSTMSSSGNMGIMLSPRGNTGMLPDEQFTVNNNFNSTVHIPPYLPGIPIITSTGIIPIENGNFITAFRTTDEKGHPLKIMYELGTEVSNGTYFPQCLGPDNGLYQEGINWSVQTANPIKGFSVKWKMPDGTINDGNGIYYNPVNFFVNVPDPKFSFFQVSYGVGDILNPRVGWTMTYSNNPVGSPRQYPSLQLTQVPILPGTEYTIDAGLESRGQSSASNPVYVVQITSGSDSWIYAKFLGYDPSSLSATLLASFQDEYILKTPVISNLTSDVISSPQIITQLVDEHPHFDNAARIGSGMKNPFPRAHSPSIMTWNVLTPTNPGFNMLQDDLCNPLPVPEFGIQSLVLISSIVGLISFSFIFQRITSTRT